MATNAMIPTSDSQNPPAPDMPLYAVIRPDGQIEILNPDIEDTPCYTLTPEGNEELRTMAAPPCGDDYGGF